MYILLQVVLLKFFPSVSTILCPTLDIRHLQHLSVPHHVQEVGYTVCLSFCDTYTMENRVMQGVLAVYLSLCQLTFHAFVRRFSFKSLLVTHSLSYFLSFFCLFAIRVCFVNILFFNVLNVFLSFIHFPSAFCG